MQTAWARPVTTAVSGGLAMTALPRRTARSSTALVVVLALGLLLSVGLTGARAAGPGVGGGGGAGGGGTAKPPPGAVAPFVTPTLADPAFLVDPASIHGFDDIGFIQDATVSADQSACPDVTDAHRYGGTVTLNNIVVTVPCNMVIQLPANTMRWADFVHGGPSLALKHLGSVHPSTSFEIRVVGNIVGNLPGQPAGMQRIAGLMFASQQSANTANGVITGFDYAHGVIQVDTPDGPAAVEINDPKVSGASGGVPTGRFSAGQSPDERFSADQGNPTVHAATGYPMCVPRTDPASQDDPLCPQQNRPKPACRNFSQAGVAVPASGELNAAPAGQAYCTQFVMPAPPASGPTAGPDARQQAPFEVGDRITYSGTLIRGGSVDHISAHTIEANVGIYTQPGAQPSYLAIGDFGVGSADPNATAVSGVPQESQNRIFLEAETTDVKTPVDIYMVDVDPRTGVVRNRWVTPFEMTGENALGSPSGGITTQNTGPQPQRARLRATKAPSGLLSQPTRTLRVVARSLCSPQATAEQAALDACLDRAPVVANGLVAGQYTAPVFEFIFPEGVKPGDAPVPFDFWHLPFLRFGEGAATPAGVGPLEPSPWGPTVTPTVTLSPSGPLDLGTAAVGGTPATASLTVKNNGPGPLTVTGVTVTGSTDFSTDPAAPCVQILAVAASCTETVSFRPTSLGAGIATLTVADDGLGNPQTVALTGTGLPAPAPVVALSPAALTFVPQEVASTSAVQTVTVTNTGTGPLTVSGVAATPAVYQVVTNGCAIAVAPAATCAVGVVFAPALAGTRSGQLTVTSDAASSPDVVALNGTGLPAPVAVGPPAVLPPVLTPPPAALTPVAPPGGPAPTPALPGLTFVPGVPTIGVATAGTASVVARFAAPTNTGGAAITGLQVQVVNAAGRQVALVAAAAAARSLTVIGLPNGTTVRVRVRAVNAVGAGPMSALSNAVTPATLTGAPRIGRAAAGLATDRVASATARWSPPASTGGAALTGYRVTAIRSTGARTTVAVPVTARTRTVTGLVRNGRYRFQVVAVNRVGAGPASALSNEVVAR